MICQGPGLSLCRSLFYNRKKKIRLFSFHCMRGVWFFFSFVLIHLINMVSEAGGHPKQTSSIVRSRASTLMTQPNPKSSIQLVDTKFRGHTIPNFMYTWAPVQHHIRFYGQAERAQVLGAGFHCKHNRLTSISTAVPHLGWSLHTKWISPSFASG